MGSHQNFMEKSSQCIKTLLYFYFSVCKQCVQHKDNMLLCKYYSAETATAVQKEANNCKTIRNSAGEVLPTLQMHWRKKVTNWIFVWHTVVKNRGVLIQNCKQWMAIKSWCNVYHLALIKAYSIHYISNTRKDIQKGSVPLSHASIYPCANKNIQWYQFNQLIDVSVH